MSPQRDVARVALVGYGLGGSRFHAPFIQAEPRLELVAVVTADPERQAEVASRATRTRASSMRSRACWNGWRTSSSSVVSTPNVSHAVVADAVLRQGRPVVVDKPVTPTSTETRRLAAQAEAKQHARRALREPALGR